MSTTRAMREASATLLPPNLCAITSRV
jgi:hypothetical protein